MTAPAPRQIHPWAIAADDSLQAVFDALAQHGWNNPLLLTNDTAADHLGQEHTCVVLDQRQAIQADAFCLTLGLVKDSGLLLWLHSRQKPRGFHQYLLEALQSHPSAFTPLLPTATAAENPAHRLSEQSHLLQLIGPQIPTAPVLITAPRGRGKSATLGLLAQRWLKQGPILVCSASRRAVRQLYQHAELDEAQLPFWAPDRLLQEQPTAAVLLLDEAASLPIRQLQKLLQHYPAAVLATTTDGYEGSGQGFSRRLIQRLQHQYPGLQHHSLQTPLRWPDNDPLEAFQTAVLLPPVEPLPSASASTKNHWFWLNPQTAPTSQIRAAYALLRDAHYRNHPDDLQQCFENPAIHFLCAQEGGRLIAVLQLQIEGGFDNALSDAIWLGQRRPNGHLLAQALTAQAGMRDFATLKGARISRLVVHEHRRRQGLGSLAVKQAWEWTQQHGLDWLGVSFGYESSLLSFWQQQGLSPVHLGYRPGPSSGEAAIQLLRSQDTLRLQALQQRWAEALPIWLQHDAQSLDHSQQRQLWLSLPEPVLSELDRHELQAFCYGHKGLHISLGALHKHLWAFLQQPRPDTSLVLDLLLHGEDLPTLQQRYGFTGKKALIKHLRQSFQALCPAPGCLTQDCS